MAYLGIDIGGINTKIGLRNQYSSEIFDSLSWPTPPNLDEIFIYIKEMGYIKRFEERTEYENTVCGIGIASPGDYDYEKGILKHSKRFGVKNYSMRQKAKEILGIASCELNDGQSAALGELYYGIARKKGFQDFAFLSLGTSIGGGLVLNRKLLIAHSGKAVGRVAHMIIDPNGPQCRCGQKGCWEAYVGTSAIEKFSSTVYNKVFNPKEIHEMAESGDTKAQNIYSMVGGYLALGISNLANMMSLEAVILGGGIAKAKKHIQPRMEEVLSERSRSAIKVEWSILKDKASLYGATVIAEMQKKLYL